MEWKNLMCLLIVAVLLTGGLAVVGSAPVKGQTQPQTVTFGVNQDRNDALISLADGDSDIYMQSLEATIYNNMEQSIKDQLEFWKSAGGYNNYYFNRAWEGHNTTEMQNAISSGWISEENSTGPLYEANNWNGEWEFNPFAVKDLRYAMNHLVDRQAYIDNLQDGFGEPRLAWLDRGTATYEDKFQDIIENGDPDPTNDDGFGLTPSGDQTWAVNYVETALTAIADNTNSSTNHFEWNGKDITFMGNVRTPSDSDTDFWQYNPPNEDTWKDVIVRGAIRTEDWRLDMGRDFADQIQSELNLKTENYEATRSTLSYLVFYAIPHSWDQVRWHFYTGGWLASAAVYYPDVSLRQMYAPAYGFTTSSWAVGEGRWHYGLTEEGQQINELTKDPFAGKVESIDDYWSMLQEGAKAGIRDSVRVFTVTETNYYCYDKDSINNAVPNQVTGWDQVFGPLSLDTDEDHLNVDYFSSEGNLYMDNWNWYGGSTGAYGANQRRWVLGYQSWNDPQTGRAVEMGSTWDVTTDYTFNETGVLQSNLQIPSSAMDYDVHNETWESVDTYYDGDGKPSSVPDVASKATISVNNGTWHDGTDFGLHTIAEYYGRVKNIVYPNTYNNNTDYYYADYSDVARSWWDNVKAIEFHPDEGEYTLYGDYTFPVDGQIGQYYTIDPRTSQPVYEAIHQDVEETEYSANPDTTFTWGGTSGVFPHLVGAGQCEDYYVPTMQKMIDNDYVPVQVDESQPLDDSLTFSASEYEDKLQAAIDFFNDNNNLFISYGIYYISDNIPATQTLELTRFDGFTDYYEWDYWTSEFIIRYPVLSNFQATGEVTIGNTINVSADGYIEEEFPDELTEPLTENDTVEVRLYNETGARVENVTDLTLDVGENDTAIDATLSTTDLEAGSYTVELFVDLEGYESTTADASVLVVAEEGEEEEDDDGGDGGIPGFTLLLLAVAAIVAVAIYHKKPR